MHRQSDAAARTLLRDAQHGWRADGVGQLEASLESHGMDGVGQPRSLPKRPLPHDRVAWGAHWDASARSTGLRRGLLTSSKGTPSGRLNLGSQI